MKEIEYKYLVDAEQWDRLEKPEPEKIVQGFLCNSKEIVVRIRVKGNRGFLTLKGKTVGISRTEFEYEIPVNEAEQILNEFTDKQIQKQRYSIHHQGKTWEVDVFEGKLSGLILAELEVRSESESFDRPSWITEDVSENHEYYNAVLIDKC